MIDREDRTDIPRTKAHSSASVEQWLDPTLHERHDSEQQDDWLNQTPWDTGDGEELYASDEDTRIIDDEAHDQILRTVLGRVPSRARHVRERHDAPPEHPEQPSLGWGATAQQPKVRIEDFLYTFSPRDVHHEELKRHIERLARPKPEQQLEPPPHRLAAAQAQQQAAYRKKTKDLEGWQPLLHRLESKTHLCFPLPSASELDGATAIEAANDLEQLQASWRNRPRVGLEQTIRNLLAAQEALDEQQLVAAETRSLQHLTKAEIERRRDELARNRALLFYQEQRAKRQKRQKSHRSRHLRKHKRERARELRIRDLEAIASAGTAPTAASASSGDAEQVSAAREELAGLQKERERQRALERASQRHRQSAWARHQLHRGIQKLDESTREAIREQHRLGEMALRRLPEQVRTAVDAETPATNHEREPVEAVLSERDLSGHPGAKKRAKPAMKPQSGISASSTLSGLAFMRRARETSEDQVPDEWRVSTDQWFSGRRRYQGPLGNPEPADGDVSASEDDGSQQSGGCSPDTTPHPEESRDPVVRAWTLSDSALRSERACEQHGATRAAHARSATTSRNEAGSALHQTCIIDQAMAALPGEESTQRVAKKATEDRFRSCPSELSCQEDAAEKQSQGAASRESALQPVSTVPVPPSFGGNRITSSAPTQPYSMDQSFTRRQVDHDASPKNPWLDMSHTAVTESIGTARAPTPLHVSDSQDNFSASAARTVERLSESDARGPTTDADGCSSLSNSAPQTPSHSAAGWLTSQPPLTTLVEEQLVTGEKDQTPTGAALPASPRAQAPTAEPDFFSKAADEQAHWVQVAFAGAGMATIEDEAEFARQKAAQLEADIAELDDPNAVPKVLPGWGFWSGAGLESAHERRMQKQQQEAAARVRSMAQARRRDQQARHVILSERRLSRAADALQLQRVPAPFQTAAQFEAATVGSTPLGPEWVTARTHEQLVRPSIQSRRGVPIAPLRRHQAL
jgi:hypothetical protein